MYTDEQRTHDQNRADESRPLVSGPNWEATGKASRNESGTWFEYRYTGPDMTESPFYKNGETEWHLVEAFPSHWTYTR